MKQETAIAIREWLESEDRRPETGDQDRFERGLALLGQVMNNLHYLASIRRKGVVNGMGTLKYELGKRVASVQSQSQLTDRRPKTEDRSRELGEESRSDQSQLTGYSLVPRNDGALNDGPSTGSGSKRFVLRNEFPFLGEKDCPDEFKVMVADMITSHDKYVKGHERLYYVADKTNEECYAAAETVVENYLNNRAIWEELEYYKKSGKILGNHPAFDRFRRRTEIENMSAPDLMKLYRTLPRNIAHAKKMIKDAKDSEGTKDRIDRIKKSEEELRLVKRMMEVPEERKKEKGKRKK